MSPRRDETRQLAWVQPVAGRRLLSRDPEVSVPGTFNAVAERFCDTSFVAFSRSLGEAARPTQGVVMAKPFENRPGRSSSFGPRWHDLGSTPKAKQNDAPKPLAAYGKLPMAFEANEGQSDPRVKFLSRGPGYTLFLTATEAVLAHHRKAPRLERRRGRTVRGSAYFRGE